MPNEYNGCDSSKYNRRPDAVVDEVNHRCATLLTTDFSQSIEVPLERIAPRHHPNDNRKREDQVKTTQHSSVNLGQLIPCQVTCNNGRKRRA